ncbi:MAG TPA: hypothetical protein VI542_05815 [Candidatus Tectomicrobia bacterium]
MIIKAYCDGTGSVNNKFMGLASIAGPVAAWEIFESGWSTVLKKYQVPVFHMTDLSATRGIFKGWTFAHQVSFVSDLLSVLYHLLRTPQVCARMTLISVEAHKRAKDRYPGVIPAIPCLCAFWCLDQMCHAYPVTDHFEMIFDRGEQLLRHIDCHWRKKSFANTHTMLSRIQRLDQDDSRRLLPLQAIDLFAWEIQRYWHTWNSPRYMRYPAFGGIEAELLLLSTQNRRWEYDDFEHLAQCRMSSDETVRQTVEQYALCPGDRPNVKRKT